MCYNLQGDYSDETISRVHVFPTNEEILHNLEGEFCFCNPKIEELPKGRMIVHNSTEDI
jgi:hypothetical protein